MSNIVSTSAASKRLFLIETFIEKYPWAGVTKQLVKMRLPGKMIWPWSKRAWERRARAAREILKSVAVFID